MTNDQQAAEIAERVQRGIDWLNANRPGWFHEIDLDNLQMSDCHQCVLGQLYGHFGNWPGYGELGARDFGFNVSAGAWRFTLLTKEWRNRITELRAFAESSDAAT